MCSQLINCFPLFSHNDQVNNMEMCQKTCTDLLRLDKDNDGATVMMADLSYRRNQYDTAMFHFQQLLGV